MLRNYDSIPILTYHSVDDSGMVISTAPNMFRDQMNQLADRGFTGVALGQILDAWEGRAEMPPNPVVLTFDDAYFNVLEVGVPSMIRHGFRATLFAIAAASRGVPSQASYFAGIPGLPLLDAQGLREITAAGFEIGGHSMNHLRLTDVPRNRLKEEIVGSKAVLEDLLGCAVDTFAYPYGFCDKDSYRLTRDAYRAACSNNMGYAKEHSDRHLLPRIEMFYLRTPAAFRWFDTILGKGYLALRGLGGRLRRKLERRGFLQ